MTTIKATVRQGRIEVDEPLDLPEGLELTIAIPEFAARPATGSAIDSDTPEAIEAWIRWYDALEPVSFTPEERAVWDAARRDEKQRELAHWDKRSEVVEAHFR